MKELIKELRQLIKLLKQERQALIYNDGEKVGELVSLKSDHLVKLGRFKGLDIEGDRETMELIEEINSLQEVNLQLTKQALAYQNSILESISKNMKTNSNTYSSKGSYESKNNANIIDQSV